jgi:hypothetical protein
VQRSLPTTERALVERAAAVVSVPKSAPADSFVLHAPLELMARVQLLSHVAPSARGAALGMIEWLAERYAAAGDPVADPRRVRVDDPIDAVADLLVAMAAGDLDSVDALAAAALPRMSAREVAGLVGEAVAPSLAAAGHAPIGLALLARESATPLPTTLLRGALRGIASQPAWRLTWFRGHDERGNPAALHEALRATPHLGRPGSDFIFPLMSQVQDRGVTERLLAPVLADRFDTAAAARTLSRVAAWSMVHDDPGQAPYGWSHCLTMPQAVMALAGAGVRARTALAVAATFTVGFRAAHGTVELPARIEPGLLPDASVEEMATAASLHEDAHLVKHTLACLHAAEADPEFGPLHLSAAARLVEWWQ